jgi:hypothetical protein
MKPSKASNPDTDSQRLRDQALASFARSLHRAIVAAAASGNTDAAAVAGETSYGTLQKLMNRYQQNADQQEEEIPRWRLPRPQRSAEMKRG